MLSCQVLGRIVKSAWSAPVGRTEFIRILVEVPGLRKNDTYVISYNPRDDREFEAACNRYVVGRWVTVIGKPVAYLRKSDNTAQMAINASAIEVTNVAGSIPEIEMADFDGVDEVLSSHEAAPQQPVAAAPVQAPRAHQAPRPQARPQPAPAVSPPPQYRADQRQAPAVRPAPVPRPQAAPAGRAQVRQVGGATYVAEENNFNRF